MTSAYGSSNSLTNGERLAQVEKLPYIPLKNVQLNDGAAVEVHFLQSDDDVHAAMAMLNEVIEEGQSWPFEHPLSLDEFRSYFLSHSAFVVRKDAVAVGVFYVKPNFPGRSGHFCNGGFITRARFRGRGIGTLMGSLYVRIARDLGYRAALFNLVYKSNLASIRLWNKLGFSVVGTLPEAGRLKGLDFVDADQYYLDLAENRCISSRNFRHGVWFKCLCAALLGYFIGRSSR